MGCSSIYQFIVGKFILNLLQLLEIPRVLERMRKCVIYLLIGFISTTAAFGQEVYDACFNALEICPNQSYSLNNIGGNSTTCLNCEDDFNFCFTSDNSIWCTFTTNATGGAVQVDFSNLVFEANPGQDNELQATIIQAGVACEAGTYVQLGSCHSNEVGNFTVNPGILVANTVYYLVIDGDNIGAGITSAAECSFDIIASGPGIARPIPIAGISESTVNTCLNESVFFVCELANCSDTSNFVWYINGVIAATTTTETFETTGLVDGDIITVETACFSNCTVTVQATSNPINVYTIPVDAGTDVTVPSGTTFDLNGTTTAPVFYWGPTFEVSIPNVLNPIITPTQTTVFSLTAEENGCVLSDYVTVTILTELDIPNTFSPNGDNVNDTWVIEGIELFPNNQISIFTRWGQKVFQTSSYSDIKSWDGTGNIGNVPEGVYFYVLDLNSSGGEPIKGTLTVLR